MPYRSTGAWPVSRRACRTPAPAAARCPTPAAGPTTALARRRRRRRPATTPSAPRSTAIPAGGRHTPAGVGFPVCTKRFPIRSDPSRPSTRPCTWNSGSPCTRVSSGVHCHASASASMSAAIARRLSTHALGRPGRAGGVHDQRGGVRRRFGVAVPRTRVQPYRDVRQALRFVGPLAQPRLRTGVGEDVSPFGRADVGGHRDDRHPGDQAAGDGQHGRRRSAWRAPRPAAHRRRVRPPTSRRRRGRCGSARRRRCAPRRRCRRRRRRPRGSARPAARQRGYSLARHTWRVDEIRAHRVARGVPQRLDDGARGRGPQAGRLRAASTASSTSRRMR